MLVREAEEGGADLKVHPEAAKRMVDRGMTNSFSRGNLELCFLLSTLVLVAQTCNQSTICLN